MMVGKKISLNINRSEPKNPKDRLVVKHLNCVNREGVKVLDDVSFTARSGEILGIAGIAGSGQRELLESIAGLQKVDKGEIVYNDPKTGAMENLRDKTPMQIRDLGVRLSFVPEDRLGMGLVSGMSITNNVILKSYNRNPGPFIDSKFAKKLAEQIVNDFKIYTPSVNYTVKKLSGGNIQKVLLGREIWLSPKVLITAYPVRGLDINSSYQIYDILNEQKKKGVGIVFVGEDLDVLKSISDRLMVIHDGEIVDIVDPDSVTKEEIGLMMVGEHIGKESAQ